uniref:Uncharacterized protein n=1 Tax=Arundo donax TaxID=35708 RepID=A0A0A8ZJ12_ARUDO
MCSTVIRSSLLRCSKRRMAIHTGCRLSSATSQLEAAHSLEHVTGGSK